MGNLQTKPLQTFENYTDIDLKIKKRLDVVVLLASRDCSSCKDLLSKQDLIIKKMHQKKNNNIKYYIYTTPLNVNSDIVQLILSKREEKVINVPTVVYLRFTEKGLVYSDYIDNENNDKKTSPNVNDVVDFIYSTHKINM